MPGDHFLLGGFQLACLEPGQFPHGRMHGDNSGMGRVSWRKIWRVPRTSAGEKAVHLRMRGAIGMRQQTAETFCPDDLIQQYPQNLRRWRKASSSSVSHREGLTMSLSFLENGLRAVVILERQPERR
jgi:hypothetical protein